MTLHPSATPSTPFSVQAALAWAQSLGLERLDAQMLLLHALKRPLNDRAWLLLHDTAELKSDVHQSFSQFVHRRLATEPLAYITGRKEFFGLTLQIDRRVLDPRADTETLVEWALSCLADTVAPWVVDLGTGSGAIALAIQYSRPDAQVCAVDASTEALQVAQSNASQLGLNVRFHASSWLTAFDADVCFDAIVANPPYIANADPHLAELTHEPLNALTSGPDGLDDLRTIIRQATQHLKPGGWLLLEHGHDQAQAVQDLLSNAGLTQVQSRADLAGILRCSGGRWPTMK